MPAAAPSSLNVFCGTWNVNGKQVKEDLTPWLKPKEGLDVIPDLYALGFQEFDLARDSFVKVDEERFNKWDKSILESLNKFGEYVQVARQQLVGMLLIIYSKKELSSQIQELDSDMVGTGYEGKYGNKGGVGIRFRIGADTFCFVNSHLNAHVHNVERRKSDYRSIVTRMTFVPSKANGTNKRQEEMQLPEGFVASDDRAEESSTEMPLILEGRVFKEEERSIFDHDHLIWLGDLNYRVDLQRDELKAHIENKEWKALCAADQLIREIGKKSVFEDFVEGELAFLPTYKFDAGTDNYDSSPKLRLPAYCDRVLWRKEKAIQSLSYDSHLELKISDHKPVSAIIRISLSPPPLPASEPSSPQNVPKSVPKNVPKPSMTPPVSFLNSKSTYILAAAVVVAAWLYLVAK